MIISIPLSFVSKFGSSLNENPMVEVISFTMVAGIVYYEVDAPEFMEWPSYARVEK